MSLEHEYETIKYALLHKAGRDYAASRGEYLSALIISNYLDMTLSTRPRSYSSMTTVHLIPSAPTRCSASGCQSIKPRLYPVSTAQCPTIQSNPSWRGGSDITGAIIARAVQADLMRTDRRVGLLMSGSADCQKSARDRTKLHTASCASFPKWETTVLHEESIFPVRALPVYRLIYLLHKRPAHGKEP